MAQSVKPHYLIIREIHLALTVSSVLLLLLEIVWPGLVRAYISLNYWLLSWGIGGIIVLYIRKNNKL